MHTAWIRAKGSLEACPMCVDEISNPDNPNFHMTDPLSGGQDFPLPCSRHGDPAVVFPENEQAFEIYFLMNANMNYIFREEQHGKQNVMKCYLDLGICGALCDAWGADLQETLPKLNIIHKELFE